MTRQSVIISFIGRGQRDNTVSGLPYIKTRYEVHHGDAPPDTPFYLNVLRQRHMPQRIHVLGTRSSSWDALIDDIPLDDPAMALRDELRREADAANLNDAAPGVGDAQLRRLGTMLAAHWRCAVDITAVAQRNVTEANVESILQLMIGLCERITSDERLILDTTHGPRPFPMLALSAIQIVEGFTPGLFARTEISYGDLVYGSKIPTASGAPVNRGFSVNLTAIREWAEIAHAAAVFERSMNPMLLAACLRRDGFADLADSLEQLGRVIASNTFERLPEAIRQLRHAVQACAFTRQEYGDLLRRHLEQLIVQLDRPTLAATLRCLAEQRAACGEYAQAILALYESLVDLACPHEVEYEVMKQQLKRLRGLLTPREQQQFDALEYARNAVAHGLRRISSTAPLLDVITAYHDGHDFVTSVDWATITARLNSVRASNTVQPVDLTSATPADVLIDLRGGGETWLWLSGISDLLAVMPAAGIWLVGGTSGMHHAICHWLTGSSTMPPHWHVVASSQRALLDAVGSDPAWAQRSGTAAFGVVPPSEPVPCVNQTPLTNPRAMFDNRAVWLRLLGTLFAPIALPQRRMSGDACVMRSIRCLDLVANVLLARRGGVPAGPAALTAAYMQLHLDPPTGFEPGHLKGAATALAQLPPAVALAGGSIHQLVPAGRIVGAAATPDIINRYYGVADSMVSCILRREGGGQDRAVFLGRYI